MEYTKKEYMKVVRDAELERAAWDEVSDWSKGPPTENDDLVNIEIITEFKNGASSYSESVKGVPPKWR